MKSTLDRYTVEKCIELINWMNVSNQLRQHDRRWSKRHRCAFRVENNLQDEALFLASRLVGVQRWKLVTFNTQCQQRDRLSCHACYICSSLLLNVTPFLQNYLVFKLSFVRRCMFNATLEKVNSLEHGGLKKCCAFFNNLIRALECFSNRFEKIKTARGYKSLFLTGRVFQQEGTLLALTLLVLEFFFFFHLWITSQIKKFIPWLITRCFALSILRPNDRRQNEIKIEQLQN